MLGQIGNTTQFDVDYAAILADILKREPTRNERTRKWVRAIPGAFLRLDCDRDGRQPVLHLRNISPMWSCAEAVWFLSGARSTKLMKKFGFKTWDRFADKEGNVDSATGFRWREAYDMDQVQEVFKKLKAEPTSRQAVMLSWIPKWDLVKPGPNAPCIIAWHFQIADGRLHMSVMQRSADMYFGFPHDILGFRIVQELMAAGLGIKSGVINYLLSNAHLYEDQWPAAHIMIGRAHRNIGFQAFDFDFDKEDWKAALEGSTTLPKKMFTRMCKWYKPWPAIDGPRLVL